MLGRDAQRQESYLMMSTIAHEIPHRESAQRACNAYRKGPKIDKPSERYERWATISPSYRKPLRAI